ncbi:MAG: hypothetical protein K5696_04840 [Lachnospiraceae bacterium]|nr:hypothetical protein [Lachnospiraceae bacterium]
MKKGLTIIVMMLFLSAAIVGCGGGSEKKYYTGVFTSENKWGLLTFVIKKDHTFTYREPGSGVKAYVDLSGTWEVVEEDKLELAFDGWECIHYADFIDENSFTTSHPEGQSGLIMGGAFTRQ